MKTLRTTLLLIAILIANTAFSQTKEETITWLKEKLGKYIPPVTENIVFGYRQGSRIISGFEIIEMTECEIKIGFKQKYGNTFRVLYTFPTDIKSINMSLGYLLFENDVVKEESFTCDTGSKEADNYSSIFKIPILKGEENIYERIEKALKHLATFCPKKTETF